MPRLLSSRNTPPLLTKGSFLLTESESDSDIIVEIWPGRSKEHVHLLSTFPKTNSTPPLLTGVPIVAYLLLICSFCTISSLGVAFDLMTGVSPLLKLFWKVNGTCIATSLICLPKLRGVLSGTVPTPRLSCLLICALGYCIWNGTFLWALDHTSIGHAYILNNSHSLVLVIWKLLRRSPVAMQEGIGMIIGLGGGVIIALDHTVSRTKAVDSSLQGDIVAFLGAIGAAIYLTNAKAVRSQPNLDFMVFMWLHMCTVILVLLPVLYQSVDSLSFSTNPENGIFGWADTSRLPYELYLVTICDFIGGMGYVRVLRYFEPIVVSIVMLLEPVLAVYLGIIVGISNVPDVVTICGSVIVIFGTGLVIHSSTNCTVLKPARGYGSTTLTA
ncbi:Drug/Metabolite Transporter (DMT) Superfamily [Thraustotheca clavata]|uniref:Drug/Metabolite Transporter (DMT) Superfamily n=1 Tax=Thraustotheca clavata TaxID=74557 RepID=A0A1V9Y924_9STRA|nr:Drug/Metabolite Transporter (DMT) Superfamily [Thraustotheca clavata]